MNLLQRRCRAPSLLRGTGNAHLRSDLPQYRRLEAITKRPRNRESCTAALCYSARFCYAILSVCEAGAFAAHVSKWQDGNTRAACWTNTSSAPHQQRRFRSMIAVKAAWNLRAAGGKNDKRKGARLHAAVDRFRSTMGEDQAAGGRTAQELARRAAAHGRPSLSGRNHPRAAHRREVAEAARRTELRIRHDVLAPVARLAARWHVGADCGGPQGRVARWPADQLVACDGFTALWSAQTAWVGRPKRRWQPSADNRATASA